MTFWIAVNKKPKPSLPVAIARFFSRLFHLSHQLDATDSLDNLMRGL
ncbi:MAG: hypothetical protein SXA11_26090 [Cyanobacteriota bacterium]|nr:hypothetical protein [Cyanobacteriota bacterium]